MAGDKPASIKKLKAERGVLKASITRIEKYVNEKINEPENLSEQFEVRLHSLKESFQEYKKVNTEIHSLLNTVPEADEEDEVEDLYFEVSSNITKYLKSKNSVVVEVASAAPVFSKLPNLELRSYSGKEISKFKEFYEMFVAVVHNQKSLSDVQRLCYLRKYLEGEALALINNLPLINDSYEAAIELLKKRYDNESLIINSHIYAILDIPTIQKGTAANIREFVSICKQHLSALTNLKQPIDQWDMIIICILTKKLDLYTNRAFQLVKDKSKLPTLTEFFEFLECRAISFENTNSTDSNNGHRVKQRIVNVATNNFKKINCSFCSLEGHRLYNCKKFKLSSIDERITFVEQRKLCKRCLNSHAGICKLDYKCSKCRQDHNLLMHRDSESSYPIQHSTSNFSSQKLTLFSNNPKGLPNIILPTARIGMYDKNGNQIVVRALLDSASQTSFITERLLRILKYDPFQNDLNIVGISNHATKITKAVNIEIHSCVYDYSHKITCAVVERITNPLPQEYFNISHLKLPPKIKLADETFNSPNEISMLLSAEVLFECFLPETIRIGRGLPVLQNTKFGYIIGGHVPSGECENKHSVCFSLQSERCLENLDELCSRFWETEKVPQHFVEYESDHEACETLFQGSVVMENNRFQVRLPLKLPMDQIRLGDSFSIALKRLHNLERRLVRNPSLFKAYSEFLKEYIDLGHAKVLNLQHYNLKEDPVYFLAHHPVIRNDKKTTKVRVVFDGSMKTNKGVCVNDLMYSGKSVQSDLFDVLIYFRTYNYTLLCDIKQMYRQIQIHPDHRQFQNILWRDKANEPVQILQLQTVTYGLNSSPFLATRCLEELALQERERYPLAANAILKNTYVDDIITGSDSIEETINLKIQLNELLRVGSFSLHKWSSNDQRILEDIPIHLQQFDELDIKADNFVMKTLGVSYNTKLDEFKIECPVKELSEKFTKRRVLQFIYKFYDPLGFAGPIVCTAKLLMQKLWQHKIGWDEVLPEFIDVPWKNFANSLILMAPIRIKRSLSLSNVRQVELIGYCDASLIAYGCCMYVRVLKNNGEIAVNLLCSKSRIAPINKKLTIPKLELNSCLLLSKLTNKILNLLNSHISNVILHTDSKICLAWINSNPLKLNAYVANRLLLIKRLKGNINWSYINTSSNPADILTRPIEPNMLATNDLWWNGPENLRTSKISLNDINSKDKLLINSYFADDLNDNVKVFVLEKLNFIEKFSSISKMQRIVAYILRFIFNTRNKNNRLTGHLSLEEIENALLVIIKYDQKFTFSAEISALTAGKDISTNIKSLNPFLDHQNILRVGGRLQNAAIPFAQKHPIILGKSSNITNLLIIREHLNLLHAGQRHVLSSLNQKFWLINASREIKKVIHKCTVCFKLKAKCAQQLMGSLPYQRVTISKIFENCGIDFCGPFYVKQSRLRKSITTKAYIALFICFSTKAIHLELVSNLTSETFIAALNRFIARRGKPTNIHCDNGSTFKGAQRQLSEWQNLSCQEQKDKIINFATFQGIKFNFIPAYSPVFGGLWEAGVKSTKYHLKRVIGNTILTFEELNTVVIQIEGVLNSRPLTQLSQDVNDLTCLTPAHFLIGAALTTYPEPSLEQIPPNRLKFWRLCTHLVQSYWKKWHNEYILLLQNRPKWKKAMPNVKEGMLVLLKDENLPSLSWPLARIIRTVPGKDNKVRVVEVKTTSGLLTTRNVTKIAVLPIYDE